MNCELEYQAWLLLDQLGAHPDVEERKRRIVERTLQRIERATTGRRTDLRCVVDLTSLLRDSGTSANHGDTPATRVKLA